MKIDPSEETKTRKAAADATTPEIVTRDILKRCKSAGLAVDERVLELSEEKNFVIAMPNGREKRPYYLNPSRSDYLHKFHSIPFEHFTYLGSYAAVCSYQDGSIEAIVRPLASGAFFRVDRVIDTMISADADESESDEIRTLELRSENQSSLALSLGPASETLQVLVKMWGRRPRTPRSLRITGAKISRHDQAVRLLEKVANSFFFELDLTWGVLLALEKDEPPRRLMSRRLRSHERPPPPEFPRHEYDLAPISLYWYARSADRMPLLRYLAFYQVIEFYFPTYSQRDAGRKLRSVLKDPAFRVDRDSDLGRLLSTIASSRSGAFGDERSQLRATLQECIDPQSLRAFFLETEQRKEFFSSKQKGLTNHKIPIGNQTADLRNETAELIYDIRCRIVHTKGEEHDGEFELLLPFSKEADLLQQDIELIEFLARRVLIAASALARSEDSSSSCSRYPGMPTGLAEPANGW